MTIAFTFPGQGSQTVGMGRELADTFPEAKAVFEEVDEALGESLSSKIWEGPEDVLMQTANTQPALMAVSVAAVKVLESQGTDIFSTVSCVAGHSLGEYSALAAIGSISVSDAAKLLRIRGEAMQKAVPLGQGAMAALIGLELPIVENLAEEAAQSEVCQVANDNAPGQVVISGNKSAVMRAIEIAKKMGGKRSILLPVSAPFHCSLMSPAEKVMKGALEEVEIGNAKVPLICNVDASPVEYASDIKKVLVRQVTETVRWRESVLSMGEAGVGRFVEIGAGKVLTGLVRRISKDMEGTSINSPDDLMEFVKQQ